MASKLPTCAPNPPTLICPPLTSLRTPSNNLQNGAQYTSTCKIALAKHKLPLLTNPRGVTTCPSLVAEVRSSPASVSASDLRETGFGGTCSLMAVAG